MEFAEKESLLSLTWFPMREKILNNFTSVNTFIREDLIFA